MIDKRIILGAMAACSAIAIAAPAQAQVAGIASANPTAVVYKSKAFAAARQQIGTTYKASFDQIQARRDALEKEVSPMLAQLDTNKDGQLSQDEQRAAQSSKSPVIDKLKTAQDAAEADIAKLTNPAARAELFAIESVLRQFDAAQLRVVTAKKINFVLSPEAFMYAPDSVDISDAIVAELDKTLPTVAIDKIPANWQPSRETLNIQQQIVQITQYQAYQAAARAQQQGAGAPAGTAPAPAGARPAAPAPAGAKPAAPKPAEPR